MDERLRELERVVADAGDHDDIARLEAYAQRSGQTSDVLGREQCAALAQLGSVLNGACHRRTAGDVPVVCPGCLCPAHRQSCDLGADTTTILWRCERGGCGWVVYESMRFSDGAHHRAPLGMIQTAACVSWLAFTERERYYGPTADPDAIWGYTGPMTSGMTVRAWEAVRMPMSRMLTPHEIQMWLQAPRLAEDDNGGTPVIWLYTRMYRPSTLRMIALMDSADNGPLDVWSDHIASAQFRQVWDDLPSACAYDDPCNRAVATSGWDGTRQCKCDLPQNHDGECMIDPAHGRHAGGRAFVTVTET